VPGPSLGQKGPDRLEWNKCASRSAHPRARVFPPPCRSNPRTRGGSVAEPRRPASRRAARAALASTDEDRSGVGRGSRTGRNRACRSREPARCRGRALTPEARHPRLKAHVVPLVDWLDLPLEPAYVARSRIAGFRGVRAVALVQPRRRPCATCPVGELVILPFVRHLALWTWRCRARRTALEQVPRRAPRPAAPGRFATPSAAAALYGPDAHAECNVSNVPR